MAWWSLRLLVKFIVQSIRWPQERLQVQTVYRQSCSSPEVQWSLTSCSHCIRPYGATGRYPRNSKMPGSFTYSRGKATGQESHENGAKLTRWTCAAPHSIAPPGVLCVTKQLLSLRTRICQLSNVDEQSGSSAHNHSTTLVRGHAEAAPGYATPELDSTHMNGLTDGKKRSVAPTAQSSPWCVCVKFMLYNSLVVAYCIPMLFLWIHWVYFGIGLHFWMLTERIFTRRACDVT